MGSCALTAATATTILGEPAEDEGWAEPHCVFSPISEPGYGQPTYFSVGEDTYPDQSVTEWRAQQQREGELCPNIVERPDLGAGAFEEHCLVDDFVGGGQKALLNLPDGAGTWQLVVEVHKARVTSDSSAADLLHRAFTVLQGG